MVKAVCGEPLRFVVTSQSEQTTYFVDMAENNGEGECDCPDFQFRVLSRRSAGAVGLARLCKHLVWCSVVVARMVAVKYAQSCDARRAELSKASTRKP